MPIKTTTKTRGTEITKREEITVEYRGLTAFGVTIGSPITEPEFRGLQAEFAKRFAAPTGFERQIAEFERHALAVLAKVEITSPQLRYPKHDGIRRPSGGWIKRPSGGGGINGWHMRVEKLGRQEDSAEGYAGRILDTIAAVRRQVTRGNIDAALESAVTLGALIEQRAMKTRHEPNAIKGARQKVIDRKVLTERLRPPGADDYTEEDVWKAWQHRKSEAVAMFTTFRAENPRLNKGKATELVLKTMKNTGPKFTGRTLLRWRKEAASAVAKK